jgi:hypothetical protein
MIVHRMIRKKKETDARLDANLVWLLERIADE